MTLYLRRDDEPPPELLDGDDRVVDLREHTDIDRLLEQIFEADLVVVW